MSRVATIDCDNQLYVEIITALQHALAGQPIFYSDTLVDLIARHCPELYEAAAVKGYRLVPSDDKEDLIKTPPHIWFDLIKE